MSFNFRWPGAARQSGSACVCTSGSPPVPDPACQNCIDPFPNRYFFTASGAFCDCCPNCTPQSCCECIDSNGAPYDFCPQINGSWSVDIAHANCPYLSFGNAPLPCYTTAQYQDAFATWVATIANVTGGALWSLSLEVGIPGNISTAVIQWQSAVFGLPFDCGQSVSAWNIVQSTLDTYDQSGYYYVNHCDLSGMSMVLHG